MIIRPAAGLATRDWPTRLEPDAKQAPTSEERARAERESLHVLAALRDERERVLNSVDVFPGRVELINEQIALYEQEPA
jgi:hypothetical protein